MWEDTKQVIRIVGITLIALAIIEEFQKPKGARTGTGKVFGFIPYDFRFPTFERFADRFWNPGDPRIVVEHPFGVGWTVNFASVLSAAQDLIEGRRVARPLDFAPGELVANRSRR